VVGLDDDFLEGVVGVRTVPGLLGRCLLSALVGAPPALPLVVLRRDLVPLEAAEVGVLGVRDVGGLRRGVASVGVVAVEL